MAEPRIDPKSTFELAKKLWTPEIKDNPYNFVKFVFPWGQPGRLQNMEGPRAWQKEELLRVAGFINENHERIRKGDMPLIYRSATASGRGVGKSVTVAWLSLWMMSCIRGSTTILSANTDNQLSSKTFAEIGKWRTLATNGYWFEKLSKKLTPQPWFKEQLEKYEKVDCSYYYAEGTLWDADAPDNFAGAHNELGLMVIFDEASGIPKPIWEVTSGFFTEISPYRFWFAFSNPRNPDGMFFDIFNKPEVKQFWYRRNLDGRSVEGSDQAFYNQVLIEDGPDSDRAKYDVYGEFPSIGENNFISRDLVIAAKSRVLENYRLDDHPLLMGIDPARFGDDKTVIRFRQGRDATVIPPVEMEKQDNMKVANTCADLIDKYNPDGIFCDAGAGAGIIDRLRELGYLIHEVQFGAASSDKQYADHRTELYGKLRDWLEGGVIDALPKLEIDLVTPQYDFAGKASDKIKLESKEDMKKRGEKSTDHADALALTFHKKVARRDLSSSRFNRSRKNRTASGMDFKIFDN